MGPLRQIGEAFLFKVCVLTVKNNVIKTHFCAQALIILFIYDIFSLCFSIPCLCLLATAS